MKKQLLLLLMILLPLVAMADISGSCGPNVTYTYVSSTNTLTIQGSGVMNDYKNSSDVPWYSYRSNIKTLVIENSVTSIGDYAFSGCSGLTSVTIPNSVTSIGYIAFYGCSSLTSVNIPNGVTSIGVKAFTGCSKLKKVIVPDIAAWCRIKLADNPLFYAHHLYSDENTEIKDLVIPSGVTSISDKTFYSCYDLSSVTIGNNVSKIGSSAFQKCTGLSSVTIGNSVKVIDALAFDGCTNLKKVIVPDIAAWCDVMFGDNPLSYAKHLYIDENTEITDLKIPNSVVSISEDAFSGCSSLINIVIPNSVLSIGAKAFYNCSSLSNVAFPNSLRLIDSRAFSGCSSLTSIEIPYSVTTIGDYAFSGCSSLTSVTLNSESIVSAKRNRGYYDIFGDQVTKYIIGNGVIHIGERAFSGCSGLTSISIGNSVKGIGAWAFENCRGLTSIEIPYSVKAIGTCAFENCRGLRKVIVSDIAAWCGISFGMASNPLSYAHHLYIDENTEISDLVIPSSVTSICNHAFSGCSGLTSIFIPSSVTTIGEYAFDNCSGLTSIIIPNSVKDIGRSAFCGCSGLTSISIGNSVKGIGAWAFSGCSGLTSITIPNSVTDIEAYAFYDCRGLSYVIIGNSVTSIGESVFVGEDISSVISLIENPFPIITYSVKPFSENTYKYATLYVPKGTTDMYKSTEGWKYFVTIMEGNTSGIATISKNAVLIQNEGGVIHVQGIDDGTRVNVYNTDGTQFGSSVSQNGAAIVNTNLQPGSIAIVKIGDKSVKVVVK